MKSLEELEAKLKDVESQPQLSQAPAKIQINAPLALIQVDLDAQSRILRWVLGLPPRELPSKKS